MRILDATLLDEAPQLLTDEEAERLEADEDVEGGEDEEGEEGIEPLDATTAVLGQLGLRVGHTLLYYFDYGDDHKFGVSLVAVQPQAEPGDYPHLVEAHGEAPSQYYGDEDEA
ncbi:MAG: plasmid pRiA4b ORF-3 family protein [Chloroflexales bacterium]|nr:plasmid pRiA4b ORF-3 family protein [Chloroflexales bacterium]